MKLFSGFEPLVSSYLLNSIFMLHWIISGMFKRFYELVIIILNQIIVSSCLAFKKEKFESIRWFLSCSFINQTYRRYIDSEIFRCNLCCTLQLPIYINPNSFHYSKNIIEYWWAIGSTYTFTPMNSFTVHIFREINLVKIHPDQSCVRYLIKQNINGVFLFEFINSG